MDLLTFSNSRRWNRNTWMACTICQNHKGNTRRRRQLKIISTSFAYPEQSNKCQSTRHLFRFDLLFLLLLLLFLSILLEKRWSSGWGPTEAGSLPARIQLISIQVLMEGGWVVVDFGRWTQSGSLPLLDFLPTFTPVEVFRPGFSRLPSNWPPEYWARRKPEDFRCHFNRPIELHCEIVRVLVIYVFIMQRR